MSRAVNAPFEKYQSARVKFVNTVADLASRPQHIEALHAADVMSLLRPLLLDNVPQIQESAAIALGRLANYSEELASDIVANDILHHLVMSLSQQNRSYKKAAAYVLRSVAKHSEHLARCVINAGALESLVSCLEEFDPEVKEVAALALAYIAKHNDPTLALQVADAGAVPLLILCVQEPNVPLKRVAATAIGEIAKHSEELAHRVADTEGAIKHLALLIAHPDKQLKKQVCACLANIAKHNEELAVTVTEADIFPKILYCLKDTDPQVRKNAANCIREIAKQSSELANIIVHYGGPGAIVDYLNHTTGVSKLPGIMTLGFIAGFDESLAMSVIVSEAIRPLYDVLGPGSEDHVKAAAAWSLGQLGRHSPQHAEPICKENVLSKLLVVCFPSNNP